MNEQNKVKVEGEEGGTRSCASEELQERGLKLKACNDRCYARMAEINRIASETLVKTTHSEYEPGQYGQDYRAFGKAMCEIRKLVKDSLFDVAPDYEMLARQFARPTAYLQMEKFPVTPNGKTDLKALPDAERLVEDMTPPETDCEKRLFEVVSKVIGHAEFGIKTAFSSAGLTSLGVVKLSVALGKAFNIPFKIRDILANDTIVKLEGFIASAAKLYKRTVESDEFLGNIGGVS